MTSFNEVIRSPVYLQVANQLREAIFSGALKAGDEIPTERELATTFGASRASVREALRVLEAQGLIATSGAPTRSVVTDELPERAREALVTLLRLGQVELGDLVTLRCVLESAAVRFAAIDRHDGQLDDARESIAAMKAAGADVAAFDAADIRFHIALARASGNDAMHLVMQALRDAAARYLRASLEAQRDPGRLMRRLIAEHERILAAIEAGEGDHAATLIESHIGRFYRNYGISAEA